MDANNVPIYVISMPTSNRREAVIRDFADYNIPFTFFDAVVGRDLSHTQKSKIYDEMKAKQVEFELTDGEIGCAESHKRIYQKMIAENIPHAVIFEDDVQIDENIFKFLQMYKSCVPLNADIVLLGGHCRKFLRTQKILQFFMLKKTPFIVNGRRAKIGKSYAQSGGSHAYYITQSGAEKMSQLQSPRICWVADAITGDMVTGNHILYAIIPPITTVKKVPSEIAVDWNVYRLSSKLRYHKFLRMFMIEYGGFKRFMIRVKTFQKKCRNRGL